MKDTKPWYKQFWPWFLMCMPFSVVILMIITLMVADRFGDNPMVVDNYYKKGKGINAEVEKVKVAQQRGIAFDFTHNEQAFTLTYASGKPDQLTALKVNFYHSTLAEKDFTVQVTANANGEFVGEFPAALQDQLAGNWTITITPFDNSWRLSQKLSLPSYRVLRLNPLTYSV